MSKNIVFEGWLTKSPPTNRIWRTKWRRRWFALRHSGELPGQYFLDYYADRNCRRLKGTINLDFCEQVDAGLHMERSTNCSLDPKLRGSVFTIQTQSRTYHLEADCESEMEKWVDAICSVCGLRATGETKIENNQNNGCSTTTTTTMLVKTENDTNVETAIGSKSTSNPICNQNNTATENNVQTNNVAGVNENELEINDKYDCAEGTGPYIPISECITGVRALDTQRAFTFDPKNIVISSKSSLDVVHDNKNHTHPIVPQIRINNVEFSENESNLSDDECKSFDASQYNIGDCGVVKSFKKMSLNSPVGDGVQEQGPPVPPRPPKTFAMNKEHNIHKELFHGPKILEPIDVPDTSPFPWIRTPRRLSYCTAPSSPGRSMPGPSTSRATDDEEDYPISYSMQYYNLSTLPPAVDRALKPRNSSHTINHVTSFVGSTVPHITKAEVSKPDVLQYLDLDLNPPRSSSSTVPDVTRKSTIIHGKSRTSSEADSDYKTVDFVKTEAFNITRQDAEASRSNQQ